jgi:hypothetical protein
LSPAASLTRRRMLQASSGFKLADTQWLLPEVQVGIHLALVHTKG